MIKPRIGVLVTIDWSQTEHDTVLVVGATDFEEAKEVVKKITSCPRLYRCGQVDICVDKHGNKV